MYHIATKGIILLLMSLLTACQTIPALLDEQQRLSVNVFYQSGTQAQSGDTLVVKLEDVSKADTAAALLSEQHIHVEQQLPKQAELFFNAEQINTTYRYTLRASLYRNNQLVMHGYRSIDPILNSQGGTTALILKPVDSTIETGPLSGKWQLDTVTGKEAWLLFDSAHRRVSGNSGCNQFFASYETKQQVLSISQAGATMKMCDEKSMQSEQEFLAALAKVASYRLTSNNQLVLLDSENKTLLSFTSAR